MTQRLVIDASVALSADSSESQDAECSRIFLERARKSSHGYKLAMTSEIEAEWRLLDRPQGQSPWAMPWLTWMRRKSRIVDVDDHVRAIQVHEGGLSNTLPKIVANLSELQTMLEDIHLIEAAVVTDKTIISRDERVRHCFAKYAGSQTQLMQVCWVNPSLPAEEPLSWLERGAPHDGSRRLSSLRDHTPKVPQK